MHNELDIQRAQRGDPPALKRVLQECLPLVAAVINRHGWCQSEHEDIIQETLLKIVNALPHYRNQCRFSTWVYRIALNACIDANRALQRSRVRFTKDSIDSLIDPLATDGLTHLSAIELRQGIEEGLKALGSQTQQCFRLFYFEGMAGAQCAQQLGISPANFFMKLKQARDCVKTALRAQGWQGAHP